MKWYNKDKTKCLNLDMVSYWWYTSKEMVERDTERYRKMVGDISPVKSNLVCVTGGFEVEFNGEEADAIYKILKNQKEVLHS
jgi:hypothetical protein